MSNLTRKGTYTFLNRRVGEAVEARGFPRTGQTTVYRAGDDGSILAGNPTANRFQTIGLLVHDRVTDLWWPADYATAPGSPFDAAVLWNAAVDNCLALDFAGYDDWRLPNVLELATLIDWSIQGGAVTQTAYSAITVETDIKGAGEHWTSTTDASATTLAHVVDFSISSPTIVTATKASDSQWVIPVRGGI